MVPSNPPPKTYSPRKNMIYEVEIPLEIRQRARGAIEKMVEI